MDLKVYALLNEKIKELAGGGLTRAEVEKIVTDEVAKIVAGAPEDFDTLKEMSDWILSHEESAASMNSAIQTNANDISALDTNKVDKVDGKSLISDTEIARLAKVTNYDDSGVKADIQTNADNIDTNKTNISTLKKHVTGELTDSDFLEDSTSVMVKTVPTGMSNYVAVKMIGGKTMKKNLFDIDEFVKTNSSKVTKTNDYTFSITGVWYLAQNITLKANTTYTLSVTVVSSTVQADVSVIDSAGNSVMSESLKETGSVTFNTTSGTTYGLKIYSGNDTSGTSVYSKLQLEEGSTATQYAPFGLINAPVESVVSVGKNIAEFSPMTEKTKMNIYGAIEKGKFLKAGKYTLSYQSDYTAFLQVWLVDNMTQIVKDGSAKAITFTLPSDGKYSIYFYKDTTSEGGLANANIRNLQLEKSNEATPYTQHFKTALLIPDSDRNLPCFGYGINETVQNIRDYENGTYTQMVAEVDLGDLDYSYNTWGTGKAFKSTLPKAKNTPNNSIANAICGLYEIVTADSTYKHEKDKSISLHGDTYQLIIINDSYTDTTAFKEAMKGVKLVYELATPVVTDCSDILHPIRVETGGTITLQNEHGLDMPNSIMYKKEVSLNG